jgi:hypothetical protein
VLAFAALVVALAGCGGSGDSASTAAGTPDQGTSRISRASHQSGAASTPHAQGTTSTGAGNSSGPLRLHISTCKGGGGELEVAMLQIEGAGPEPEHAYQAFVEFDFADGTRDFGSAEFAVPRLASTSTANAVGSYPHSNSFTCRVTKLLDKGTPVSTDLPTLQSGQSGTAESTDSQPSAPPPAALSPATHAAVSTLTGQQLCALLSVADVNRVAPSVNNEAVNQLKSSPTPKTTNAGPLHSVSCTYMEAGGGARLTLVVVKPVPRDAQKPAQGPYRRLTIAGRPAVYSSVPDLDALVVSLASNTALSVEIYQLGSNSPYRPAVPLGAPIPPEYLSISKTVAAAVVAGLT